MGSAKEKREGRSQVSSNGGGNRIRTLEPDCHAFFELLWSGSLNDRELQRWRRRRRHRVVVGKETMGEESKSTSFKRAFRRVKFQICTGLIQRSSYRIEEYSKLGLSASRK